MPEDKQQQTTVAGLVPAALYGFNQPFNLAAGEVLSVAVVADRRLVFLAFASVHHFVESFSRSDAPNPA
jgi:hypothetical protein